MASGKPGMSDWTEAVSDRFADVFGGAAAHREEHGCDEGADRELAFGLAVLARMSRASYVLFVDAGLGYEALHVAAALGLTGRIEAVEEDEVHVAHIEQAFARHGLAEKLSTIAATPEASVPYLNGPYDLIIDRRGGAAGVLREVHRLLRAGGAYVGPAGGGAEPALCQDERWLAAVLGPHLVAVKIR